VERLSGVFGCGRSDEDIEQELQVHLELVEQDLLRQGLSPEAAAREARLRVGRSTQAMETLRDRRGIPPLSTFWLDAKLGLRMLRKHWGLTLIGGLTLATAMAIGASVFNLTNVIRGTALPLEEGSRVVVIQPFDLESRQLQTSSMEDFKRWRSELRSVESVSAFRTVQRNLVTADGPPVSAPIAEMSASGFQVSRIAPLLGRFLFPEDEAPSDPPVVVIGYDVWRAKFAGDPAAVGRQVRLDGVSHTIVGVMPQDFGFPVSHQYWTSLRSNSLDRVVVFARIAPGASLETAHAEVRSMGLVEPKPVGTSRPLQPRVVPYVSGIGLVGDHSVAIMALLPLVLPLLLVPPCANIAILVYARTVARQSEFATRSALGASRGRIVMQILIEVLLLTAGAAGLALVLASKIGVFLRSLFEFGDRPFWMDFSLSYQTILFAGVLAVIAAMIAGGIPALRATGRWKSSGLNALRGGSNPQLGTVWTVVVAAQIALSVAAAPTVVEVAWETMRPAFFGPGFDAGKFLTTRLIMDRRTASDPVAARFGAVRAEIVRRLEAEPGVIAATMSETAPFEEPDVLIEVDSAGAGGSVQRNRKSVALNHVDGAFFDVLRVPLLTGRRLAAGDFDPARGAVVVNRSFSRQILGDRNPLGRRIRVIDRNSEPSSVTAPEYEIVGVVGDLFAESRIPTMYRPLSPSADALPQKGEVYQVRLTLHAGPTIPPNLANRLQAITAALDPALRVDDIQTLDEIYWRLSIGNLAVGGLIVAATLCGVLFSAAGVYTSMAFTVVQRRREIGIRTALGAPPWRLAAGVFRQALLPVGVGVALGGLAATMLDYYLSPLLFDSGANGRPLPWILPAAEAFILVIAVIVLRGPVRRALRVGPIEAMRES
jgi:putative ABC transport system permease protein